MDTNKMTEKALSELSEKDLNVKNLITAYWCLKGEEKEVMNRIRKMAKNMKKATLLITISGIEEYSTILILGEIGDIMRFKTLKWILYECSGRESTLDPRFQSYYYKVQKKKGFKTARRAVARKMLVIIWHMLTKEEPSRMASWSFN